MRFMIRDLLWLTALAAVLVAWWLDRDRLIASYRHALEFEHRKRLEAEREIAGRQESFRKLEKMWMHRSGLPKPNEDGSYDFH